MRTNTATLILSLLAIGIGTAAMLTRGSDDRREPTVERELIIRTEVSPVWTGGPEDASVAELVPTASVPAETADGVAGAGTPATPTLADLRRDTVREMEALDTELRTSSSTRVARVRETEISDALDGLSAAHSFSVEEIRCADALCSIDVLVPWEGNRDDLLDAISLAVPRGEMFAGHNLSDAVPGEPERVRIFVAATGQRLPLHRGTGP